MEDVELGLGSVPATYDMSSMTYNIYSEDFNFIGIHTLSLLANLRDYSTTKTT